MLLNAGRGPQVLIDEGYKPWLIEVNASPSLSCSTPADRHLKQVR